MELSRRLKKLQSILDVAKAMAAARQLDSLLPLVVKEATHVVDADRCTLYLVDLERKELWSKVAGGSSTEIRMPWDRGIAGHVVSSREGVNLADAYADPRFNRAFDQATGYQTRTVLAVPMLDAEGAPVGVLQALNKLEGTFTSEDEELLLALAGQAAGAVENAILHEEIHGLFEGFVNASVVAIESRDPTTAGHSGRVAELTLGLARALEQGPASGGPYAGTRFTQAELQELRYASLLHDFGKVGVREHVLMKAEKLHPHQLECLRMRFALAAKDRQVESYRRRLEALQQRDARAQAVALAEEEGTLQRSLAQLDELWDFLLACNRPTVLERGGFERLLEVGQLGFQDARGAQHPLLSSAELQCLSIPKGSLSEEERREIESHVTHTFRFLSRIPWTRDLRRVPEIAFAHHERSDGTGYPRAMAGAIIPLQSKMMAISDVYDALTATDRPYKKAVPHAKALDILQAEATSGKLDRALLSLFVEAEVPRRALGKRQ